MQLNGEVVNDELCTPSTSYPIESMEACVISAEMRTSASCSHQQAVSKAAEQSGMQRENKDQLKQYIAQQTIKQGTTKKQLHLPSKKKKKEKGQSMDVRDAHRRVHFLEQAATYLSIQGSTSNDSFAKLSRKYSTTMRQIVNSDVLKVDYNTRRTMCKKCNEVFVTTGVRKFTIKMDNNVLVRKCLHCGKESRFQNNPGHKSRNERAKTETGHNASTT